MLKIRVIPILTFNGFGLVKTKIFSNPRMVGNPLQAARVYNSRDVDELVFLDIRASEQNRKINFDLVKEIVRECMMPLAIGGGIADLNDIEKLLKAGADKVVIKTKALLDPGFIKQTAAYFGRQCITVSADAKITENGYVIYNKNMLPVSLEDFLKQSEDNGAGEFIVTSVDNDGMMTGFDIPLINIASGIVSVPVVACGGGGNLTHYKKLFEETKIEAVASASIFHFTQYTPNDIKRTLLEIGLPVRENIQAGFTYPKC